MNKANTRGPDFDKALARLEEIVQAMESGSLPLEKMMERFEEGMRLVALCSAKLDEVERKIEMLVKKGGQLVPEPFNPEEGKKPEG